MRQLFAKDKFTTCHSELSEESNREQFDERDCFASPTSGFARNDDNFLLPLRGDRRSTWQSQKVAD
jgi:hypothetical protein